MMQFGPRIKPITSPKRRANSLRVTSQTWVHDKTSNHKTTVIFLKQYSHKRNINFIKMSKTLIFYYWSPKVIKQYKPQPEIYPSNFCQDLWFCIHIQSNPLQGQRQVFSYFNHQIDSCYVWVKFSSIHLQFR